MDFHTIDSVFVIDIFLLLLIGVGPKIALVPFIELTASLDKHTKTLMIKKMIKTASITAIALIIFGKLLTKLLHFSTGALSIAGGIILLIVSVTMVLNNEQPDASVHKVGKVNPMQLAVFPLAVPYLLNPAGIVTLVTVSAEAVSNLMLLVVIVILAAIILLDIFVFRWANKISDKLDSSRMLVTEKVFGFLLAALAVQLVLDGLSGLGVIHLTGH